MKFGIDRLLEEPELRKPLPGRRVALLAHPASVTRNLVHSLDALAALGDVRLSAAFGPQHGLRGDKQDNMVESQDYTDPVHGIPVFSLYGEVRRPTPEMMDSLRRSAGRSAGSRVPHLHVRHDAALRARGGCEAAQGRVGSGSPEPCGPAGGRADAAAGLRKLRRRRRDADAARPDTRRACALVRSDSHLDVDCQVVPMEGWEPNAAPGYGWPLGGRTWVNPSPNAPNLWMARCYPGSVMLEGTTLVGRAWHHAAAGDARRAGSGRARVAGRDACAGGAMDEWLSAAALLVRAHVSQARRASSARASRCTWKTPPTMTTRDSGPGDCSRSCSRRCGGCGRTIALARLCLRVREGPARDRRDQRQRSAAPLGGRSGGDAGGSGGAGGRGRVGWAREREPVLLY